MVALNDNQIGGWHKHPYVYVRGLIASDHMQGLYNNNICSSVTP